MRRSWCVLPFVEWPASGVELNHVAVRQRVVPTDVLPVEPRAAPHARILERAREFLVHESGDVLHRLTAVQDERPTPRGWATRRPRVHARDSEVAEQPGTDLPDPESGARRHGEGRIPKPRDVEER